MAEQFPDNTPQPENPNPDDAAAASAQEGIILPTPGLEDISLADVGALLPFMMNIQKPPAAETPGPTQPKTRPEGVFDRLKARRGEMLSGYTAKKYLGRTDIGGSSLLKTMLIYEGSLRSKEKPPAVPPLPEREPHELPLTYLNRCIALTPEETSAVHTAINQTRAALSELYFDDPLAMQNMEQHVTDVRWKATGGIHDPAPHTFVAITDVRTRIEQTFEAGLAVYDHLISATEPHTKRAQEVALNHRDKLAEVGAEAIQQSALYETLHSFGEAQLVKGERPLTAAEEFARQSMIAGEVIKEFGIRPSELGKPTEQGAFYAQHKYRRGIYALDDEHKPNTQRVEVDSETAFQKFREWSAALALESPKSSARPNNYTDPKSQLLYRGGVQHIISKFDTTPANHVLTDFLERMVEHAYEPNHQLTYTETLEAELLRAQKQIGFSLRKTYDQKVCASQSTNMFLLWLRQTDCTDMPRLTYKDLLERRERQSSRQNGMHSAEAVREKDAEIVGTLLHDERTPAEREFLRIIFELPYQELPIQSKHEPVLTVAWGSTESPMQIGDTTLHIPGFVATAQRQQGESVVYDFIRDPNGDPYAASTYNITEAQRQEAAKIYHQIGARKVSDALHAGAPQTISEFAQVVRQNSVDYTPEHSTAKSYTVANNELLTQCQGSAELGNRALVEAKIMSRVVGGLVLNNDSLITKTGHAQVLAIVDGKKHIVDFSPSKAAVSGEGQSGKDQSKADSESKAAAPLNEPEKPTASQQNNQPENQVDPLVEAARLNEYARSAFTRTHAAFEQKLTHRLGLPAHTPSAQLYEKFTSFMGNNDADFWWQAASVLTVAHTQLAAPGRITSEAMVNLETLQTELRTLASNTQKLREFPKETRTAFTLFNDDASLRTLEATALETLESLAQITRTERTLNQA